MGRVIVIGLQEVGEMVPYVRKLNGVSHKPFQVNYILNVYVITGYTESISKA